MITRTEQIIAGRVESGGYSPLISHARYLAAQAEQSPMAELAQHESGSPLLRLSVNLQAGTLIYARPVASDKPTIKNIDAAAEVLSGLAGYYQPLNELPPGVIDRMRANALRIVNAAQEALSPPAVRPNTGVSSGGTA